MPMNQHTFLNILITMRPRQWTKNVLLFAGLFFSKNLLDPDLVERALAGFCIFCLLSSSAYLLNDLLDAPRDRLHPTKRHRPIAAGTLAPRTAVTAMVALVVVSLIWSWFISSYFWMCSVAYLLITIAYSCVMKEVYLIDTLIIAMGFIIRAVSGVIVLRTPSDPVELTSWFVVCVMFLSLLLAFCKRRSELVNLDEGAASFRPVLAMYSVRFMDGAIAVCAAGSILSYTLYTTTTKEAWTMLASLPFVIYGIFRYLHLVYNTEAGEAPEKTLIGDLPLLGCIVLWGMSMVWVYFPSS